MQRLCAGALGVLTFVLAWTISEQPAYSHKPITTPIIFKKEIAQIFQRKCFQCHSENNLAMPLTTYELARPWAVAIREEILARHMPPWGAVEGFGHFVNDLGLTQREMDIILSWTDGGAPSGVLKAEENIPPVFVPPAPTWEGAAPDEVIALPGAVKIDPGSGDRMERFEVKSKSAADARVVKAIAFKPGDRRVVRYAAIYEAGSGRWLWTWTPWQTTFTLPDGFGYRLSARTSFAIEIGYRAADELASDTSELGLYLGPATASPVSATLIAASAPVDLKPGADPQKVRADVTLASASRALALWPAPGPGAKSVEVSAIAPDGVAEPLVWIKDFRADWPTPYVFRTPVALAKGTRLVMTTYYQPSGDASPQRATPRATLVTAP